MSSEQTSSGVAFHCDECGEVRVPGGGARLGRGSAPREWSEEWADAKAAGWRARRVGNKWVDRCPDRR